MSVNVYMLTLNWIKKHYYSVVKILQKELIGNSYSTLNLKAVFTQSNDYVEKF